MHLVQPPHGRASGSIRNFKFRPRPKPAVIRRIASRPGRKDHGRAEQPAFRKTDAVSNPGESCAAKMHVRSEKMGKTPRRGDDCKGRALPDAARCTDVKWQGQRGDCRASRRALGVRCIHSPRRCTSSAGAGLRRPRRWSARGRQGSSKFQLYCASSDGSGKSPSTKLPRGGAVWQLVGLITRRSQVQILPPQPDTSRACSDAGPFHFSGCAVNVPSGWHWTVRNALRRSA
jgi:hypothetical protein